jgi:transcriptional regulator with PAS, ATPase and Fis domain
MQALRIGFICTYTAQKNIIEQILANTSPKVESAIDFAVLDQAIPIAKRMEKAGAEAIVAWSATTKLLEKHISIPVASISVRDLDVMRALLQAKRLGSRIAIVMDRQNSDMQIIEEVLGITIKQIVFKDMNDLQYGLMETINDGYEVILAKSHFALDLAKQYDRKGILITVNSESIVQAIDNARWAAQLRREANEQFEWLKKVVNSLTDGILVCDQAGLITLINKTAQEILGVQVSVAGQPITRILPDTSVAQVLQQGDLDEEILSIDDKTIIINYKRLSYEGNVLGVVTTLKEIQQIQRIDAKMRKRIISKGFVTHYSFDHFACRCRKMRRVIDHAKRFAVTNSDVLIMGETGTGKEVMAQSIHSFSQRSTNAFVAVNCGVIPENLLESELFGYEDGAFTGAKKGGKIGLFELAHHGTLFLDEIGNMPMNLQSKLLRVIQEREVMRLGGDRVIPVDVRIIAATNSNLPLQVQTGLFREDLYFRMSVLVIEMPPLRERAEDIPTLVSKFLDAGCMKYGKKGVKVSQHMVNELAKQSWHGNVRQLNNLIERYILLSNGTTCDDSLMQELLSHNLKRSKPADYSTFPPETENKKCNFAKGKTIGDLEREWLLQALYNTNFNISRAADSLSMSRSTLYHKMKGFKLL